MSRDWTKPEPKPVRTDSPEVWPLVLEDLRRTPVASRYLGYGVPSATHTALTEACRQRHEFGIRKHGLPLQVENGRNPLRDLLDEALDAVVYSRQHFERTRLSEDWDLHVEAIRYAARVVGRVLKQEHAHE